MVKARDLGILALLGVVGLSLFRKGSASFPEGGPAIPSSVLQGQLLQAQFDQIGDVLEQQNTTLQEAQRLLSQQQQQQNRSGLNFSFIPSGALLGISLGAPLRAGSNQAVTNFGKVPSNFRQGSKVFRPRRNEVCTNPGACL